MYLSRKNTLMLVGFVLVAMLVIAPILFFILRKDDPRPSAFPQILPKEQKPARTQEEIWTEYAKNINELLNLVNTSEENTEVILFKMEAVFLSISVPSEERELYLKTFLQIQKLKSEGAIDSKEKMREYVVPLLVDLLNKN